MLIALALPGQAGAQQIVEVDPTPLGGTAASPSDINSVGQVAGTYTAANGVRHAFIWTSAGMLDIESDPNATSFAAALNDAAIVVGQTTDVDGDTIAFRWAPPGPMERITVLNGASIAGRESTATDINNDGAIVGYARGPSFFGLVDRGFRLDPGAIRGILLSTLGGAISRAFAINEVGAISGQSEASSLVNRATLWSSTFIPFPTQLDTATSNATSLNNLGATVGFQFTGRDNIGTLWRIVQDQNGNDVVQEIRLEFLPNHVVARALAIGNQSSGSDPVEIVGFSRDGAGDARAVRWTVDAQGDQTLEDLNDLLPAGSGWVLGSARGLNDRGQITGTGTLNGETRGFVFDPAGEPPQPPALLFVHGILANNMYRGEGDDEDQVWPPGVDLLGDMRDMRLTPEGEHRLDVTPRESELVKAIPIGRNIYKKWLIYMQQQKDAGVVSDFYSYSYDWRFDWRDIINDGTLYSASCLPLVNGVVQPSTCDECGACVRLQDKLAELATASGRRKVWIVTHSNGALVTKTLLTLFPNLRQHLAGVIFVAGPHLGTPQSLLPLLHGEEKNFIGPVEEPVQVGTRVAARTWPNPYALLPNALYFERVIDPVFEFKAKGFFGNSDPSINRWIARYGTSIATHSGMQDFLLGAPAPLGNNVRPRPVPRNTSTPEVVDEALFFKGEQAHRLIESFNGSNFDPPLPVYQIAGWGLETVRGIQYKPKLPIEFNLPRPRLDATIGRKTLDTCEGDITVVVPSASALTDATTFYLNLRRHNRGGFLGLQRNRRHRDILEVEPLQTFIGTILRGEEPVETDLITLAKPTEDCDGARLRVRSPAKIHLFQDGLHTGPIMALSDANSQGVIEEDIPNSQYRSVGEGREIFVDSVGTYDVVLEGTGVGLVNLELDRIVDDENQGSLLVPGIPVRPGSLISFVLDPSLDVPPELEVDVEGDGIPDFVLDPGATPTPELLLAVVRSAVVLLDEDTAAADLPDKIERRLRRSFLEDALEELDEAEEELEDDPEDFRDGLEDANEELERYQNRLEREVDRGRASESVAAALLTSAADIEALLESLIVQVPEDDDDGRDKDDEDSDEDSDEDDDEDDD